MVNCIFWPFPTSLRLPPASDMMGWQNHNQTIPNNCSFASKQLMCLNNYSERIGEKEIWFIYLCICFFKVKLYFWRETAQNLITLLTSLLSTEKPKKLVLPFRTAYWQHTRQPEGWNVAIHAGTHTHTDWHTRAQASALKTSFQLASREVGWGGPLMWEHRGQREQSVQR